MGERVKIVNEYLTTITSILSFFGTLFIIVSYFVWKDIRSKSRRILVYISIADFCTAVATVAATASFWLTGSETKQVCFIQSIIGTLSVLCSFFWTAFMAVYLYLNVCKKTSRLANRLLYFFHMCGWGVPVVIVSIGASTNKLGNNGDQVTSGWCWVNKNLPWNEQVLWMFLAGKLWEIMACLVIVLLYGLLKRSMTKKLTKKDGLFTRSTKEQAQKAERKLICVPLIFVILRSWGTIRFLLLIAKGPDYKSQVDDGLLVLQGIGDNAPGFANFLLFCFFTDKFLGRFHWWLRSCCAKCFAKSTHRCSSLTIYCEDPSPKEPLIGQQRETGNGTPVVYNYASIQTV